MIFLNYKCCQCYQNIIPEKAYPQDDDEFQFCSEKCHNEYVEKHGKEPSYVIKNMMR